MKIAFISPPITGHLNPMTTLARSVRKRGHEVVFISLADAERFIQAAGLAFLPCGEKEYPAGSSPRVASPFCTFPVFDLTAIDIDGWILSTFIDGKGNRTFLSNLLSTPALDRRSVA